LKSAAISMSKIGGFLVSKKKRNKRGIISL